MDADLRALLSDLFERGAARDAAEPDRLRRLRNLEPATAELLTLVLRIAGPGRSSRSVRRTATRRSGWPTRRAPPAAG